MRKFREFIAKYCYIVYPTLTFVLFLIIKIILNNNNVNIILANQFSSTIVQISGGLIGFLLTAFTIFLSLPKDTKIMQRVKKYNHHIIFSRCIFCGIFSLVTSILLWCFNINEIVIFVLFFIGLEETIISAYYIYKLCIYNFE